MPARATGRYLALQCPSREAGRQVAAVMLAALQLALLVVRGGASDSGRCATDGNRFSSRLSVGHFYECKYLLLKFYFYCKQYHQLFIFYKYSKR